MSPKKTSSRLHTLIKTAFVAVLLPIFFVYIVVAKPDYNIMNGLSHIVFPIAHGVGNVITWPIRATGRFITNIHNISKLEQENEELRTRLYEALANKNECEVAIIENQKLAHELDVVRETNYQSVVADVIYNNSATHHGTFIINRGTNDGISRGMVVVSFDNTMAGIIIDAGYDFARVRSLIDSDTNIAVRVAGSEVYGFLRGNGSSTATLGFLSDHKFQVSPNIKLVTSNISGVLPPDIYVGQTKNETDVEVQTPGHLSRVIVLKFNAQGKYK